jgi:hypothetical protein
MKSTTTHKVVNTIDEWFWHFEFVWRITAHAGTDTDHSIVCATRTGHCEIVTTSEDAPRPSV